MGNNQDNVGINNEETAVLKQPFDLAEIQKETNNNTVDEKKNDVGDEPPKEYDEQELPGPQDNRGMIFYMSTVSQKI